VAPRAPVIVVVRYPLTVAEASEVAGRMMAAQIVSKADLAGRLNKSRAWVTQLLSGKANMTVRTLAEVAYTLGAEVKLHAQPPSWKMAGKRAGTGADPPGVRDIKVTSPGEAPQERKEVNHGARRGEDCEIDQAPAGAKERSSAPSRGYAGCSPVPRLAPWATLLRPDGLEKRLADRLRLDFCDSHRNRRPRPQLAAPGHTDCATLVAAARPKSGVVT
jgi:transcriptional regulator with XRE-family HTH domain